MTAIAECPSCSCVPWGALRFERQRRHRVAQDRPRAPPRSDRHCDRVMIERPRSSKEFNDFCSATPLRSASSPNESCTAMQVQLGISACATTDLDVAFRGHVDDWLERFDATTADTTRSGFTVTRRSELTTIDIPGLGCTPWRVPLQVRYDGRAFGTIAFESRSTSPRLATTNSSNHQGLRSLRSRSIHRDSCRVSTSHTRLLRSCMPAPNRERAATSVSATSSTSGCSKRSSSRNSSPTSRPPRSTRSHAPSVTPGRQRSKQSVDSCQVRPDSLTPRLFRHGVTPCCWVTPRSKE